MREQYFSHIYKTKQHNPINLTSLIFKTRTYLNLTERSLSETGRARSQFRSGWIKLPLLNFFYLLTTSGNLQSVNIVYISLGFLKFKVLAPKRIHTRSHPDPEPAIAVDDPEKLLRKKNTVEGSGSHSPLHRSTSLPKILSLSRILSLTYLLSKACSEPNLIAL
jgi:hypothetical protein